MFSNWFFHFSIIIINAYQNNIPLLYIFLSVIYYNTYSYIKFELHHCIILFNEIKRNMKCYKKSISYSISNNNVPMRSDEKRID